MALFLGLWGLYSFVMFLGTLYLNRALQVVFALLTILFALLAAGDATGNEEITHIAGYRHPVRFDGHVCGGGSGAQRSVGQTLCPIRSDEEKE